MKDARTEGLCNEYLVEVFKTCPNLEVAYFGAKDSSADWRLAPVLGMRVSKLFAKVNLLHGDEYASALKQCSNSRELYISGKFKGERGRTADEMIANVFSA